MKNKKKLNPKKNHDLEIVLMIIISFVTAFVLLNTQLASHKTASMFIIILCLIGMGLAVILLILTIKDMLKFFIKEYKNNNDLFSGILMVILIGLSVFSIIRGIGNILFNKQDTNNIYITILKSVLSAIPTSISLLFTHYFERIHKKEKQEELLKSNMPYPLIEMSTKANLLNSNKKTVSIKVNNLADNVLIPISIGNIKLDYKPVTKSNFREFKNLELPSFENNQEILFIYEDINNTQYKTKLHINNISDGKLFDDYKIIENEKPILIDENEVTICNEGDLH